MPLLLTNEEVESVLTTADCIPVIEQAYRDLGAGEAINRPRSDMYLPNSRPNAIYAFKSMEGGLKRQGIVALRINSDVITWRNAGDRIVKDKLPVAPGGKWVGLVFLFSADDGSLLAIFPDGVVQRMRVGATNGVAAKYLAREDAKTVGLFGSGWQAGAQCEAMCAIRPITRVNVYSPTSENRKRFAEEMRRKLGIEVVPVKSASEAAKGADILVSATNAVTPVIKGRWVTPGMHVTCVKQIEPDPGVYRRADLIVVHTKYGDPENYILGHQSRIEAHDPLDLLRPLRGEQEESQNIPPRKRRRGKVSWPELADLLSGRAPGRTSNDQVTCFVNNIGLGIQFAAVGAKVYELARAKGLGRELPDEWFLESVHP